MIEKIMSAKDEEILVMGGVEGVDFKPKKGLSTGKNVKNVMRSYFHSLRVIEGEHYCIPCSSLEK